MVEDDDADFRYAQRLALTQLAEVLHEDPPGNRDVLMDLAVLCSLHPDEALVWAVAAANAGDALVRAGGILCIGIFGSDAVAYRPVVVAAQSDPNALIRMAADSVAGLVVESRPPDPALQAAVREAVKGTPFAPEHDSPGDGSSPS